MTFRLILGGLAKAQAAAQPTRWITSREGKRIPVSGPAGAEPKRDQRRAEIAQQVAARRAAGPPPVSVIAGGRVKPIGATSQKPQEKDRERAEAEKRNWYRSYVDTSEDPNVKPAAQALTDEMKASKDRSARSALNQGLKALGLLAQDAKNGPIAAVMYQAVAARASWIAQKAPDQAYANAMGIVAEVFDQAAGKAGKGPVTAQTAGGSEKPQEAQVNA